MKYVVLVSALHYRFSTPSTAVYCRYLSVPIYKYLFTYTPAKYEELALEIWLTCQDSGSCLCICVHACNHRYLHPSTCTSIFPSICPSMYHSVYPAACLYPSVCPSVFLSVCPSVCLYIFLYMDQSNHPSIHPSIQLLIHLK